MHKIMINKMILCYIISKIHIDIYICKYIYIYVCLYLIKHQILPSRCKKIEIKQLVEITF